MLLVGRAVAGNGGSAYTMFGLGDLRYYPSARSAAMGYSGIGLPSANSINSIMPASWSRIGRVRLEANAMYEGINTAEANKALYQAKGLFNGAMLAIPISPANGIVFVGGFSPYSYVGYNTSFANTQDTVSYRINEIGSGGLTKAQAGLSYAPTDNFSLGVSLNYLFGRISLERSFQPSTAGTSGGSLLVEEANRGIGVTFGAMYTGFGKVSEALAPFSLGITFTTKTNVTSDVDNVVLFAAERDTFPTLQKTIEIPVSFGVGLAYQLSDRWLFAADYSAQAWRNARDDGQPFLNIRNSSRFGIGAEKLPIKDATRWLDKLSYRLGFSYAATYFQIFGEPINEWAFTGGFGIPIIGETRLNVGIEYAQRGNKTTSIVSGNTVNLVKDSILRVMFSLSISDLEPWFVRREEE